jgi:hypothetical protein
VGPRYWVEMTYNRHHDQFPESGCSTYYTTNLCRPSTKQVKGSFHWHPYGCLRAQYTICEQNRAEARLPTCHGALIDHALGANERRIGYLAYDR